MERYQGKKVVIIGGTSGIGLATAKMLLAGGARVLVTGRSQAGLDSAQKELGAGALVVASDARSLTDLNALAAQVKAEFDTFDLLFVNAGFSIPKPFGSHIQSRQGCAAVIRPRARRRTASSGDSRQRGVAWPYRHGDPRKGVSNGGDAESCEGGTRSASSR